MRSPPSLVLNAGLALAARQTPRTADGQDVRRKANRAACVRLHLCISDMAEFELAVTELDHPLEAMGRQVSEPATLSRLSGIPLDSPDRPQAVRDAIIEEVTSAVRQQLGLGPLLSSSDQFADALPIVGIYETALDPEESACARIRLRCAMAMAKYTAGAPFLAPLNRLARRVLWLVLA